jgi:hypothetical protein
MNSDLAIDWPAVEAWLGTTLPDDYKQLADTHGPMDFGDYIWIHVPCVQDDSFDYGSWLRSTHREARIKARGLPEDERYAVHPEPGGLLAFGMSRATDVLYWDTSSSDDPNRWTVVVQRVPTVFRAGGALAAWCASNLTLTEYLRHAVDGTPQTPAVIGPLPDTFARTAYIAAPQPWTPPAPTPQRLTDAERRVALETGTGLDALRLLVTPPEAPYLGERSWSAFFDALGTRLPSEYVALMELYGAGCWSNWLRFDSPLRIAERDFRYDVGWKTDAYREHRGSFPQWYPLGAWPEPGGILPFADSIDGDQLCWLTAGDDPDAWPLIVWPRHSDQGPALERGLIDTLLAWQRGQLRSAGLPAFDMGDDPLDFVRFDPWDESSPDF